MKTCVSRARLAALPLALAAAFPSINAVAQTSTPTLAETVVTATRNAQPIGDVIADVTIIDRETIERAGPVGLADLLTRVPGFQLARNGGIGNSTSIFTRGGESRHTMVMIDGVRVESQSTSGGATWSNIPISQIDHIEIVRGPSSAVYGSDAVAGVIQIFTKKGQGAFSPSITLGAGTYDTKRVDLSASGTLGAFDYSVGATQETSNGFNIRPIAGQNPDKDGYAETSGNAKLGYQLNADHRLEATILQSTTNAQYDSGLTRDFRIISHLQTLGANWQAQWTKEYSTKLSVTEGTDNSGDALNGSTPVISVNKTRIRTFLFFNEYKTGNHTFNASVESRSDKFLLAGSSAVPAGNSGSFTRDKSQDSVGVGYGFASGAHTLQLNVRHDNDSEFGGKTTGSAGYAYAITPQWKVSGGAGTSFRAPTLYQRFSIYGTPNLQPESGRNVELGLKYSQGTAQYGVTAYRNRLTNLLTFASGTGPCINGGPPVLLANRACYANTAQAEYTGLTFTAAETLGEFHLYGSLDLQNPKNLQTHRVLARRARQYGTVGVDTRVGDWTIASDLSLVSSRFDSDTNNIVLGGYSLLGVSVTKPINREWKVLAKLDNVADRTYQTASGYASAGRTFYVALTWTPF